MDALLICVLADTAVLLTSIGRGRHQRQISGQGPLVDKVFSPDLDLAVSPLDAGQGIQGHIGVSFAELGFVAVLTSHYCPSLKLKKLHEEQGEATHYWEDHGQVEASLPGRTTVLAVKVASGRDSH